MIRTEDVPVVHLGLKIVVEIPITGWDTPVGIPDSHAADYMLVLAGVSAKLVDLHIPKALQRSIGKRKLGA